MVGKEEKSSRTARHVAEVQRRLPRARVVYVSATGASELSHMSYMDRLGLWGTGTSFNDAADFIRQINSRGTGGMEMVAMDMKGRGMFIARTLSYRGAEFSVVNEDLSPEYRAFYNHCARLWARMKKEFEIMKDQISIRVSLTPTEQKSLQMVMGTFWGTHQRFFNQLCLGAKVPAVVRLAKEALANDQCCVIGLQSTGEARTDAHIAEHGFDGCDFLSTSKLFIQHVMKDIYKIGNEFECGAPAIPHLRKVQKEILAEIDTLEWPPNPLDAIIDMLGGPEKVAEMTGRSTRTVRRPRAGRGSNGQTMLVHEKRFKAKSRGGEIDDSINITERKNFQSGRKLVAIISDAASTGISLHADRRVKNQKRRLHITLELPWSADKAVQQLGRSHRSNQKSSPIFKLLITTIGGEWRFASAVASRLEQLGALTQGDRRAGGAQDMSDFVLDTKWGHDALNHMLANIQAWASDRPSRFPIASEFITDEYSQEEFATEAIVELTAAGVIGAKSKMKINTFLNRLFGVQLELQKNIFRHLLDTLDRVIVVAKQNNQYSEGITDVTGESMSVASTEVLWTDPISKGTVNLVTVLMDRGISWETALQRYQKAKSDNRNVMFLRSKNPPFGHPRGSSIRQCSLVIARAGGNEVTGRSMWYGMHKPAAGISSSDLHKDNLQDKNKVVNVFKVDHQFDVRPTEEWYVSPSELTDPVERRVLQVVRDYQTPQTEPCKGIWKTELAKILEMSTDQLTAPLRKLVQHRLIKQKGTRTDFNGEKSSNYDTYQRQWTREYTEYDTKCSHHNCHVEGDCDYGRRKKKIFVITGSLLGIWACLPKARGREEAKIVRISCDDGERVVGLRVMKEEHIEKLRIAIKEMEKKDSAVQPATDNPNPEPICLDSFTQSRQSKTRVGGGAIRKRSRLTVNSCKSPKGTSATAHTSTRSYAIREEQVTAPPSDDEYHSDDCVEPVPEAAAASNDEDFAEYYGDEVLDDCGMWEDVEDDVDDEAAFTAETTVLNRLSQSSQDQSAPVSTSEATGDDHDADEQSQDEEDKENDHQESEDEEDEEEEATGMARRAVGAQLFVSATTCRKSSVNDLSAIWDHLVSYKLGSRVLSEAFMEHPSEDEAPGYDDVIVDYIDLSLIRDRLDEPTYSLDKMKCDVELLKSNAERYNEEGSQISRDATTLYRQFLVASSSESEISTCEKELHWTGETEYEVEKIMGERTNASGVTEYKVRWEGYGEDEDTWEPQENVEVHECWTEYIEQKNSILAIAPDVAEAMEEEEDDGENAGGDGFGSSDEGEGEFSATENEQDDGAEQEMNDEDREFIVEDGMAEDSDDDDEDHADDDVITDDAGASADRDNHKPAQNAESTATDPGDGWEQSSSLKHEEGEPRVGRPILAIADGSLQDTHSCPNIALTTAASAMLKPPGSHDAAFSVAAADAALEASQSAHTAMESKAAAISAAREKAAAAVAKANLEANAAISAQEQAREPTMYLLRQTNGPPLPCSTIALPGPTTENHRNLQIGRATAKPPASSFRLRVLKGANELKLEAIDCKMTPGWSFRIGKVLPAGTPGLVIQHSMLSRHHLTIFYDEQTGSFKLRDVSTNGVFVDGLRVGPTNAAQRALMLPRCLHDGNTVSLGDPKTTKQLKQLSEADSGPFVFVFESMSVAKSPGMPAATSSTREHESITTLQLPDPKSQVSRKHATLTYLPESNTFTVTDHGSLNGVFANRLKIQPRSSTPVSVGTELVIGGYKPQLPVGSRLRKLEPWVFAFVIEMKSSDPNVMGHWTPE